MDVQVFLKQQIEKLNVEFPGMVLNFGINESVGCYILTVRDLNENSEFQEKRLDLEDQFLEYQVPLNFVVVDRRSILKPVKILESYFSSDNNHFEVTQQLNFEDIFFCELKCHGSIDCGMDASKYFSSVIPDIIVKSSENPLTWANSVSEFADEKLFSKIKYKNAGNTQYAMAA